MQKQVQEVIESLAKEYNLPPYVIEEIVRSQFIFTREKIKEGNLKTIMLAKLGKFSVSMKKLKWIQYYNEKNRDKSTGGLLQRTEKEEQAGTDGSEGGSVQERSND